MKEEATTITVQVSPGAAQNKVVRFKDGVLHLRIAATPVNGKANEELIKFLSSVLGVRKNRLTIEKGATSRKKVVAIGELEEGHVIRLLEKYLANNT